MQEQQINIDINQTTEVKCEECENNTFVAVTFLRKVSRLISPDGQDHLWPLETMACAKCGHVNKEFNPTNKIIS
jgi:ribosomal protein S27E